MYVRKQYVNISPPEGGVATPIKQMSRYLSLGVAGEVRQRNHSCLTPSRYGKTRSEFREYPAAEGSS
jgi:hypothetical protein